MEQASPTPQENELLLQRLKSNGVEFVIIGGFCAVIYGAARVTYDLDICCAFDETNLRRIEQSVRDLHPRHRLAANKLPLELTSELCTRLKNLYLQTTLGKLDCLSEVAGVGTYPEVLRRSTVLPLSFGEFRFLTIDSLIDAKQAVGRPHDIETVLKLNAIKEATDRNRNL